MDPFFFRAAAMAPRDKKLVISVEQGVSATSVQPSSFTTIGGYIDYALVMAPADDTSELLGQQFYP